MYYVGIAFFPIVNRLRLWGCKIHVYYCTIFAHFRCDFGPVRAGQNPIHLLVFVLAFFAIFRNSIFQSCLCVFSCLCFDKFDFSICRHRRLSEFVPSLVHCPSRDYSPYFRRVLSCRDVILYSLSLFTRMHSSFSQLYSNLAHQNYCANLLWTFPPLIFQFNV